MAEPESGWLPRFLMDMELEEGLDEELAEELDEEPPTDPGLEALFPGEPADEW